MTEILKIYRKFMETKFRPLKGHVDYKIQSTKIFIF